MIDILNTVARVPSRLLWGLASALSWAGSVMDGAVDRCFRPVCARRGHKVREPGLGYQFCEWCDWFA